MQLAISSTNLPCYPAAKQKKKEKEAAEVESRSKLLQLLKSREELDTVFGELYTKEYNEASDNAKLFWGYLHCELMKEALSKKEADKLYSEPGNITKEKIKSNDDTHYSTVIGSHS